MGDDAESGDPLVPVVFLSIDPEWAEAQLRGDKPYEYRRVPPAQEPPYRVVLYATGEVKAVVGDVLVDDVVEGPVGELVDETAGATPHDPADLSEYFEDKEEGSALHVTRPVRYDEPVTRRELHRTAPEFTTPQNFCYLRPGEHDAILQTLPRGRDLCQPNLA